MARRSASRVLLLLLVLALAGPASPAVAQGKKDDKLTDQDVTRLHDLLHQGKNWKSRSKAAKVLGALRRPESVPHLIRCLRKDEDHLVRGACAWALGALEHPGAMTVLYRVAGTKEPEFVKTQAKKALDHILSRYPENLPQPGQGSFRIAIAALKDEATQTEELTPWLQQYFLERLMVLDSVEVGNDMAIEDNGETFDSQESFEPEIRLAMDGGITRLEVPPERAAGKVKATLELRLKLLPVNRVAWGRKEFVGEADFEGGPPPASAWDDDPLIEAQKAAVRDAVAKAYAEMAPAMRLE